MSLLLLDYVLFICLTSVPAFEANRQISEQWIASPSSSSINSCTTPHGKPGTCIPLPQCRSLVQLKNNVRMVRRSRCGFQGRVLKVCCENTNIPMSSPFQTTANVQRQTFATLSSNIHLQGTKKAGMKSLSTAGKQSVLGRAIYPGARFKTDDSCFTPTEESGSCIPLIQCRNLIQQRNIGLVKSSICGFEGKAPKVCCASIDDDDFFFPTAPVPIPNTAPPDLNSKESRKSGGQRTQNLFPSECGISKATFTRIVGGQESAVGAWPWMAAIYLIRQNVKNAECGGVLVTKKHIITAAHCIVNSRGRTLSPQQLTVRLGDHDIDRDDDGAKPIELSVRKITKHSSFDQRTFQNDIAIFDLASSVEFGEFIAPICLPLNAFNGDTLARRNAFTAGWGSISYGGPASSKLLEVQLKIWDNDQCKEVFQTEVPITEANLCAGEGDKDACRGDSGGPLMLTQSDGKFYLAGIVSFGKKCAEPGYPGVYTRVSKFIDWIERHVENSKD